MPGPAASRASWPQHQGKVPVATAAGGQPQPPPLSARPSRTSEGSWSPVPATCNAQRCQSCSPAASAGSGDKKTSAEALLTAGQMATNYLAQGKAPVGSDFCFKQTKLAVCLISQAKVTLFFNFFEPKDLTTAL